MHFTSVRLDQISALVHDVKLPPAQKFRVPEFKVVSYQGEYQARGDALYILATTKAAHEAWYSESIILDFSGLHYRGGDEMAWVLSIGRQPPVDCPFPLVIVTGPGCEKALQSLLERGLQQRLVFADHCTDSIERAIKLVAAKREAFKRCCAEWKPPKA
ncbi:hypothetical protein CDL60_08945 [Roseateles noduli]|nr:hypothetical protein CDL60_08945 [Roseateles noduli]